MTIVISRTKNFNSENYIIAFLLQKVLQFAIDRDVYISSNVLLYKEILPIVDKMCVTEIDLEIPGDTFFQSLTCILL